MIEQVKQSDPGVMKARREKDEPPAVERRALPTPERIRRAGADFDLGDTGQITMRDSPLERARARKLITHQQYSVGQKYRHHWYHAGLADQLQSIDVERIFAADHQFFRDGEDRSPGLSSATISRGDAGRRQDRVACARLGGVPGNSARSGRLYAGLEQPSAGLCRSSRADETRLDELSKLGGLVR